jgi:hypothetical protein
VTKSGYTYINPESKVGIVENAPVTLPAESRALVKGAVT